MIAAGSGVKEAQAWAQEELAKAKEAKALLPVHDTMRVATLIRPRRNAFANDAPCTRCWRRCY